MVRIRYTTLCVRLEILVAGGVDEVSLLAFQLWRG